MRCLALILLLAATTSCTMVRDVHGRLLYSSTSNNQGVHIRQTAHTTDIIIANQDNSTVMKEHGNNITKGGAAVMTSGILSVIPH